MWPARPPGIIHCADFPQWGYCLIEDALSTEQCQAFLARLLEQAEGERQAGIDQQIPTGQYINTLINKGPMFAGCIEQDPMSPGSRYRATT